MEWIVLGRFNELNTVLEHPQATLVADDQAWAELAAGRLDA